MEWNYFQPSVANTCFQEKFSEHNLLVECFKERKGNF